MKWFQAVSISEMFWRLYCGNCGGAQEVKKELLPEEIACPFCQYASKDVRFL